MFAIPALLGVVGALVAGWRGMLGMTTTSVIVRLLMSSKGLAEGEMFIPSFLTSYSLALVPGSIVLVTCRQLGRTKDRRQQS